MNIEEAELYLNSFIDCYNKKPKEENRKFKMLQVDNIDIKAIETLIIAYEKEKEENVKLRLRDIPFIEGELKAYKDRVNELKIELEKEKEKNKELKKILDKINEINFPNIT
jgi:hypothetical protein